MAKKFCEQGCTKSWDGDDPNCGFDADGVYKTPNWNCGLVNRIRYLVYEGREESPVEVDYQYCDDQKYATINVNDVDFGGDAGGPLALWLTWYKNRGATEDMWFLDYGGEPPRKPTRDELLSIVRHFEAPR